MIQEGHSNSFGMNFEFLRKVPIRNFLGVFAKKPQIVFLTLDQLEE